MIEYKLGEIEMRFAELIWQNEPIASGELVKRAEEKLSWNRSTTYTILRRFSDRGLFQNKKGIVTSLISKEEFAAAQSEKFVEETFSGSLPSFIAAFSRRKKLSEKDLFELQKFIDSHKEV